MKDCLVAQVRVLAVGEDGSLRLEPLGEADCRTCSGVCRALARSTAVELRLLTPPRVVAGDACSISVSGRTLLWSALWVHGLPWAGLLLGALVGARVSGNDLGCMLGAAAGLLAATVVLHRRSAELPADMGLRLRASRAG
jgi:positive regulator of sigma E activity